MDILHGTWVPPQTTSFANTGQFFVWIETVERQKARHDKKRHPCHLFNAEYLDKLFTKTLPLKVAARTHIAPKVIDVYAMLPCLKGEPLPSVEMTQLTGQLVTETAEWQYWTLKGIATQSSLLFLKEISFLLQQNQVKKVLRLGQDMQFWIQYAEHFRQLISKHQFLPRMKAYENKSKTVSKRKTSALLFEAGWEPASQNYEQALQDYAQAMPLSCRALFLEKKQTTTKKPLSLWQAESLLRHFSEQQMDTLARNIPVTQKLGKTLTEVWISNALERQRNEHKAVLNETDWRQWANWKQFIVGDEQRSGFVLGLRISEGKASDDWEILFFAESRKDPSLRLTLKEIWALSRFERKTYEHFLGVQFEKELLLALGQAARIVPLLWDGLETSQPTGIHVRLQTAYEFLKDDVEILEAAGFKISVPAWWTPKGRQRARIRVKASGSSATSSQEGNSYFSTDSLVQYRYELAVGDEAISEQEWQMLVNAKSPLVQFRGQWMEINSQQMSELLALWQKQQTEEENVSLIDLLKQTAEAVTNKREFVFDEVLESVLSRLLDRDAMPLLAAPFGLKGELREYQKQGLSWLAYQEAMGLHPCLADDMGLGKTIQVLALLLQERQQQQLAVSDTSVVQAGIGITLLIAPTSVLGNWEKESKRFSPDLRCLIHHGSQRETKPKHFKNLLLEYDILITSFNLIRRDIALFKLIHWHRVVIDEAQNIKNPKSAQTKAIKSLKASHRLAMTGTPIENRLMDVWSIFHFLNPGYLGTAAQFKKSYETPVQRDGDVSRSEQLKKLLQPFILRRLKTDKNIINDLPDKIEQKVYCNLTQEQASLYQAVVDDVQQQIEEAEGIDRKGLILATLMKLKQICNHPAQFLQDGSAFSRSRSHKLARADEMIEEALEEGNSLLLFTQFTEVGSALEQQWRERYHRPIYYLHGGTSRKRREAMIENFQDENTPAGIFILSLKAGGVGITLTRANHVFHFDRWWNPAVENQATDRAFRIGQKKTVFAHKFVTLGTLEERIDQMLEDKQKLAESIVGSDEAWLTEMDNDAFCELIQLNRNTILEA